MIEKTTEGSLERAIIEYAMKREGQAFSSRTICTALNHPDYRTLFAGLDRLRKKGLLFRFKVDERDYYVAWTHRKQAFVIQKNPMSDELRTLYAAFGSKMPAHILRTPLFRWPDDEEEDEPAYSRYLDDYDLTDDPDEVLCENVYAGLVSIPF